jgi:energy-coupling factor transporter ATP-binding protein EcfA2
VRLTKLSVTAFRGIAEKFTLNFDNAAKNILLYGENGSAKSSLSYALELLFDPEPNRDLFSQRNRFAATEPKIEAEFVGRVSGKKRIDTLTWTSDEKPTPPWLLAAAARSAFLDHRKLLLLSDRTRDLSENFFRTSVAHLFSHLPTAGGLTVGQLWKDVNDRAAAYRTAQLGKGREAESGLSDPVAHHKPIEDGLNALNLALDDYLLPLGGKPPRLVSEATRLLSYFEHLNLTLALQFDHLSFNRTEGTFEGGRLRPEVNYCGIGLTMESLNARGEKTMIAIHHEILNEARLTALALVLFFAAVRLQNEIPYTAGPAEQEQPARLLVMDDVLVGLDYDHRLPILEIIRKEFEPHGYQVILLTHNRVWFDIWRLQMAERTWKIIELYSRRGAGPGNSDHPVQKQSATDLLVRSREFLADHELPAAANYARSAVETALKKICDKRGLRVPFRLDHERYTTEVFLNAIKDEKKVVDGKHLLVPKDTQSQLRALRKTVLNELSHWHPTTATTAEVNKAIAVAEVVVKAS